MLSLASKFHNMKLQYKILLSFAAVIVLTVLLVVTVIYRVTLNTIKENSIEYARFLNEQIGINLDSRTRRLEDLAFELFVSSNLNRTEELDAALELEYERLMHTRYVSTYMDDLLYADDAIEAVLYVDAAGRRYTSVRRPNLNLADKLPADFPYAEVRAARGRAIWVPGEDSDLVFMGKALFAVSSSSYAGTVVLGIDSDYIRDIYTKVNDLTEGSVLILNENGLPIIKEELPDEIHGRFLAERLYEKAGPGVNSFSHAGENYIYSVLRMPNDRWRIAQIINVRLLTRGAVVIQFWTVTVLVAALALAFLTSLFISRRMTESIRLLLQSMSRMSIDFTHQAIQPRSRDEIGILTERFNSMSEKINELINKVYKEQMLKREAEYRTLQSEYKTLQAQINPHFLYNALESIQSLAKLKGEDQIGDMVYLLGSLLRDAIGRKGDVVRLREEVDFISKYLQIQRFMYEDRISVEYDLPEPLMDCRVPKFVLQPLVENAIVHGIERKPGKGAVRIAAYEDGGDLVLEVEDNGAGMDAEEAERLLRVDDEEVDAKPNHTSVGLRNVQKRVRYLYGDEYGIQIRSRPGEGTLIRVRLPIRREEDGNGIEKDGRGH